MSFAIPTKIETGQKDKTGYFYTLIRVSWAPSGSLLKFRLYDFNDYDDDWARF